MHNTLIYNRLIDILVMIMQMKPVLFIALAFGFCLADSHAQVQNAYNHGDTVFRYKTSLDIAFSNFSEINLLNLYFPCVDRFLVQKTSYPNIEFELKADGYREFYTTDATVLKYGGNNGPDPFLGVSRNLSVLSNPVPIMRSTRKDDFYEKSNNELFLVYELKDLPTDLATWLQNHSASTLRINAVVESTHSYKGRDIFDNLLNSTEGFVIENENIYRAINIEIRKGKWENISMEKHEILSRYFGEVRHHSISFYGFDSLEELARISYSPQAFFYFNSRENLSSLSICRHLENAVYIYPNPTFGDLLASFQNYPHGKYNFSILNIIGKKLWSTEINYRNPGQRLRIELPYMAKGIYLYKITDSAGKIIHSRRLVLMEP